MQADPLWGHHPVQDAEAACIQRCWEWGDLDNSRPEPTRAGIRELDRQTDILPFVTHLDTAWVRALFLPLPRGLPWREEVQQPLRALDREWAGMLRHGRCSKHHFQCYFIVGWVIWDPDELAAKNTNKNTLKTNKQRKTTQNSKPKPTNPNPPKQASKQTTPPKQKMTETNQQNKKNQPPLHTKTKKTNGDIGREKQVSVSSNEM